MVGDADGKRARRWEQRSSLHYRWTPSSMSIRLRTGSCSQITTAANSRTNPVCKICKAGLAVQAAVFRSIRRSVYGIPIPLAIVFRSQCIQRSSRRRGRSRVANQGSQIAAGWSVVTRPRAGTPNNDVPCAGVSDLHSDPPSQTGLNPVPEPSQIILMFTLIALIAEEPSDPPSSAASPPANKGGGLPLEPLAR